jgi:hypothetical protein
MNNKPLFLLISALSLAACEQSSTTTTSSSNQSLHITGIVQEEGEPVTHAKIEAKDSGGATIATSELRNNSNHYAIDLPAGTQFPVVLTAIQEGDRPLLKAAITSSDVAEQDISTVTTLVVDTAIGLGGLTSANLAKAAGAAISMRRNRGGSGSSSGFKGDPTKQYGGWH